jgi:hypothetical protein
MGVDIGDVGSKNTLLHIAAWRHDFELTDDISERMFNIDIHAKGAGYGCSEAGHSVLSLASGRNDFVDLFVAHGANVWDPSNLIDGVLSCSSILLSEAM